MTHTNKQLQAIIKDAESKIGTHHAVIVSKEILVAALKELLERRK